MSKPTKDDVYRKAHQLTLDLYQSIRVQPEEEGFDLAQELRHAAFSTSMALCPDLHREDAIDAACGSSARLECLLILAQDLGFFRQAELAGFRERAKEIGKALQKMNSKLRGSGS
jgi:hypothetical protein